MRSTMRMPTGRHWVLTKRTYSLTPEPGAMRKPEVKREATTKTTQRRKKKV